MRRSKFILPSRPGQSVTWTDWPPDRIAPAHVFLPHRKRKINLIIFFFACQWCTRGRSVRDGAGERRAPGKPITPRPLANSLIDFPCTGQAFLLYSTSQSIARVCTPNLGHKLRPRRSFIGGAILLMDGYARKYPTN